MIRSSPAGSLLSNAEELIDPSPSYQVVLAAWMDFFLLNRKKHLCDSDLATLQKKGKNPLRLLSAQEQNKLTATCLVETFGRHMYLCIKPWNV